MIACDVSPVAMFFVNAKILTVSVLEVGWVGLGGTLAQ